MFRHVPSHHLHGLLGGALSVMVHGGVLFGWSQASPSHSAEDAAPGALVWFTAEPTRNVSVAAATQAVPGSARPTAPQATTTRRTPRADASLAAEEPANDSGEAAAIASTASPDPGRHVTTIPVQGTDAAVVASGPGNAAAATEALGGSHELAAGRGAGVGEAPVQGPRLLAAGNPCAGYFPARTRAAHGRVQVEVDVRANGQVAATRVMTEQPLGEGFARAASACAAQRLQFAPARSAEGTAVGGNARLVLRFERS